MTAPYRALLARPRARMLALVVAADRAVEALIWLTSAQTITGTWGWVTAASGEEALVTHREISARVMAAARRGR